MTNRDDDQLLATTLAANIAPEGHSSSREFVSTHWSVVLQAQETHGTEAEKALEYLCGAYWYPLYAFVRKKYGSSHQDAEDLTQAFFAHLISKRHIGAADRERGRFRTFLITYFEHFAKNEWRKQTAQKRGGGKPVVSIDEQLARRRYDAEPKDEVTAGLLFDRRWALRLFEMTMESLEQYYADRDRESLFAGMRGYLIGIKGQASQAETAAALGMKEATFRAEVHRMRRRFADLIREKVAQTVASSEEVESELKYLCSLLA